MSHGRGHGMADLRLARRRGRPPVEPGQRSIPLSLTVGDRTYDAIAAEARANGQDVSTFVRAFLRRHFFTEKSTPAIQ